MTNAEELRLDEQLTQEAKSIMALSSRDGPGMDASSLDDVLKHISMVDANP